MICAVILANSLDSLITQGETALYQGAKLVECRLDGINDIDFDRIDTFLKTNDVPIIFALRTEWNKQQINPPIHGRREALRRLIDIKPKYIDLEYPLDMSLLKHVKEPTIPVLSVVDFDGIAKIAFDTILDVLKEYNKPAIIKISATPNSVDDLKQLWRWAKILQKQNIAHIVIGMGQLGQLTRIKSRELGNRWTYGRIGPEVGEPFLPGMMSIKSLENAFSDNAWHLASLGQLPENDALREIYGELLTLANLNGTYINIPINTTPELDQMLLWVEDGLLDGVNITSPWQVDVLNWLELKDPSVLHMNAANCVVVTADGLKGYNTQIEGVKRSLEPYSLKRIKRVYIEGTNQTARAVIKVLRDYADSIVIRDKLFSQKSSIFDEFPETIPAKESFYEDFDLVVNCITPDRGFENVLMLPHKIVENARIVFDPVSKINEPTPLMRNAIEMEKQAIGGFEFFFNTAIASFELWTKRSIPPTLLDTSIFQKYQDHIDLGFMFNY